MEFDFRAIPGRLFGPDFTPPGYLAARWLFLRALGLIFFSAFYSLAYPDSRAHRPEWNSSRAGLPRPGGARFGERAFLVRAHRFLVVGERPLSDGALSSREWWRRFC